MAELESEATRDRDKSVSTTIARVRQTIELLANSESGFTHLDLASELNVNRRTALRLLDGLVESGVVLQDEKSGRYRGGLIVHQWGSHIAARYSPAIYVRQEIAELAASIHHVIFYTVLEREWSLPLERYESFGRQVLTTPPVGMSRTHWTGTPSGMTIVGFSAPLKIEALLSSLPPSYIAEDVRATLEGVRRQGYMERLERYMLAVPVLDRAGYATAALGMAGPNPGPQDRDKFLDALKETAARCSSNYNYDP